MRTPRSGGQKTGSTGSGSGGKNRPRRPLHHSSRGPMGELRPARLRKIKPEPWSESHYDIRTMLSPREVDLMDEWMLSGQLSQRAFCRRHDLVPYWFQKPLVKAELAKRTAANRLKYAELAK